MWTKADVPPDVPARVGEWVLDAPLGAGSFGSVYRARDGSGRVGVVKLLAGPAGDELRALAKVHHPAVVAALGGGNGASPYLVMSLAPGAPLTALQPPLTPDEVTRVVAILADALAACHQVGVVHGDVKPANVVLDRASGRPTLVDFGLAGALGGTVAYAAPEVLQGAVATEAADVYGLGLVAYELLAGALPWSSLDAPARLARRASGSPPPPPGPRLLAELVVEMLHPRAASRPTAEAIADRLEAAGIQLFVPTAADLLQRAATLRVTRPSVAPAVAAWLAGGGALAVSGPPGSGRSQLVAGLANELLAQGRTFLSLGPAGVPWGTVACALQDEALPGPAADLPAAVDVQGRADAAAEALLARAEGPLAILVDDWDLVDPASRDALLAASRLGAALLVAGEGPDPGMDAVALAPLDERGVAQLLAGLLGPVDPQVAAWVARGPCWPLDVVSAAISLVDRGVAVWRRRAWVVHADALDALPLPERSAAAPVALSADAARLGAVIAAAQPVSRAEALGWAGTGEQALDELAHAGAIRGGSSLTTTGAGAGLLDAHPDRVALCRALRDEWVSRAPISLTRLARVLAGAEEAGPVTEHGAACVRALADLDAAQAVALAADLWRWAPGADLAAARVEALARAGRGPEARTTGSAWLAGRAVERADVPLLVALARLEDQVAEDPDAMLRWLALADPVLGDERPPDVALARARALFRAHRLEEAAATCRAVGEGSPVGPWLASRAMLAQVEADLHGAEAGLAVLALVPPEVGRGTGERALLDATYGRLLWHVGRPREAARAMEAAAALRRVLPIVERARLDNNAGLVWYSAGDVDRAVAGWERALLGFERIGAELEVVRVLVNLCQGFRDLGRWGRAEDAGRRAVEVARAHAAPAFEAVALGNLGDCSLSQRRFTEAEAYYDQAEPVATAEGLDSELVELARRRAELAAHRGDPDAPDRAIRAIAVAETAASVVELARGRALLAWARAHEGRIDEFRRLSGLAVNALRALGATAELAVVRLAIAEGWLALGREREATAELELVVRYADEFGRPPLRTWADRVAARLRRAADGQSRIEWLTKLAVQVAMHTELDVLLRELASALVELIDAERALVLLIEGGVPRIVASAGAALEKPPSMSIVNRVVSLGREVVVTDLEERADLRYAESVVKMRLRAVFCMPLIVEGAVLGVLYLDSREQPVGALHDATSLVRALAAHASIALRNARQTAEIRQNAEFAREIAHDLRNPLSGITLVLSDVVDGGPPLTVDDARLVLQAAQHATELVHQTLGAHDAAPETFALSEAIGRWIGPLRVPARQRGVRVALEAEARGLVRLYPGDLQRVLANLIANAVKYSPDGGLITVRTSDRDQGVALEITDAGPGIAAEALERVFERGYQAAGALPGHGLGLSIVRRIALQSGGWVTAANAPGGGAAVTFWLPAVGRLAGAGP